MRKDEKRVCSEGKGRTYNGKAGHSRGILLYGNKRIEVRDAKR